MCIQEHRYSHTGIKEQAYDKWKLLTISAWTNSINAATGGIRILVMIAHFQGNPHTSVISCYSPTNVSDDQEM